MDTKKRALKFALVACLLVALIAIVAIPRLWQTNSTVVYSLNLKNRAAVELAVAAAIANPRTVIYVNVNWSATAVVQREDFERFATDWQRTHPALPVSFYCIDFTSTSDYSPIKSLPGWAETLERTGRFAFHGNGELAWVVDGRLVDVGRIGFGDSKEFIQQTARLFAESNGDAPSIPMQ